MKTDRGNKLYSVTIDRKVSVHVIFIGICWDHCSRWEDKHVMSMLCLCYAMSRYASSNFCHKWQDRFIVGGIVTSALLLESVKIPENIIRVPCSIYTEPVTVASRPLVGANNFLTAKQSFKDNMIMIIIFTSKNYSLKKSFWHKCWTLAAIYLVWLNFSKNFRNPTFRDLAEYLPNC